MSTEQRIEHDAWGDIPVPGDHLWGAQTQRSIEHFAISTERMPPELLHALALVKSAAARVNERTGLLPANKADAIAQAAAEVIEGRWEAEFPLAVWQTGSGTQSNMNMNEVLANRASQTPGRPAGPEAPRASERRGQPGPVVQRRVPHRDARRRRAGHRAARDPVAAGPARHAGRQGQGLRRHRQDRPHPPAGRHAAHAGPGDLRLGRAARSRRARAARGAARAARAGAGRHGGGHRPEHAGGVRRRRRRRARSHDRPGLRHRAQQVRGARRARRDRARARRAQGAGRGAHQDRQRRALARQRPAQRPGRAADSRERAGQLHHAGQGQPDAVRGDDDAVLPGDRQRRRGDAWPAPAATSS